MSVEANSRIVSLDGIRAVAALVVFISHNGLEDRVPGGFGVSIFFFLSGYLISTLLRVEYETTGSINLKNFYLRRVFRILPPLYIVLLLSAVPPLGHLRPETARSGILAQVFQMTNYWIAFFGSDHIIPLTAATWSLAVEEHFYMFFPLGLRWMLSRLERHQIALALLGLCVAVMLWRCVLVFGFGVGGSYTYFATDTRIDSLLFGCVMAMYANPVLDKGCLALTPLKWSGILALSFACLIFSITYRNPYFRETFRYSLQGVGLFAVFFCAIRYSRWLMFRWLEHPWMRFLGLISYTFYLSHEKSLQWAGRLVSQQPIVKGITGFLFAVGFSTAMYFLVERQFAALRRRLHGIVPIVSPA